MCFSLAAMMLSDVFCNAGCKALVPEWDDVGMGLWLRCNICARWWETHFYCFKPASLEAPLLKTPSLIMHFCYKWPRVTCEDDPLLSWPRKSYKILQIKKSTFHVHLENTLEAAQATKDMRTQKAIKCLKDVILKGTMCCSGRVVEKLVGASRKNSGGVVWDTGPVA